jgi:hypothetical protein
VKVEQFIHRLDIEQTRLAVEAVSRPSDKTDFGYGYAAGLHAGLEHAKQLLFKALEDAEKKDNFL